MSAKRRVVSQIVALLLSWRMSVDLSAQEMPLRDGAKTMAARLGSIGRKAVATVDFTDTENQVTCLGRFLAEEFSVHLAGAAAPSTFTVIERTQLKLILEEQKLGTTGIIDPRTSRQIGRIAGVDTIVAGTVTPFGDTIRVLVKAFDTETAGLVATAAIDIARTKAIDELMACNVRTAPEQSSGASTASNQRGQSAHAQTVTQRGVIYTLQACTPQSASLACELVVSHNVGADQDVMVGSAKLVDSVGNQVTAERIEVGQTTVRGDQWTRAMVVAGTQVRVRLWFDQIPKGPLELLEFESNRTARDGFFLGIQAYRVQFRKVPVDPPKR